MGNVEDKKEALLVFGQNIRKTREMRNLDISELASLVHYDRVCLSRLEYGEHNVSYMTAIKLAKELNISFPSLFSRNYKVEDAECFCEDNFLMVFIENTKRELKMKGMIQTRIYIECGVQEASISRLFNGKMKNPTLNTLCKIATVVADGNVARLFLRNTNVKEDSL